MDDARPSPSRRPRSSQRGFRSRAPGAGPIVGDFAGSADDDIIWYAPGPTHEQLWTSDGDGTFTKSELPQSVSGDYIPVVGNFGGDAHDDILWYNQRPRSTSVVWIEDGSEAVHFRSVFFTINGVYQPFAVVNHATRDSVVFVIMSGQGSDPVWNFTGSNGAVARSSLPESGAPAIQLTGDFNGDGYGDFFQYGLGNDPDVFSLGQADHSFVTTHPSVGSDVYEPVVADIDSGGDGRDDIVWYNESFSSQPLPDPIWHGNADGTFEKTFADLPDESFPIFASSPEHFVELGNVTIDSQFHQADEIWTEDGVRTTGNTLVFKDAAFPVVGSFTNDTPDLLRYVPGKGKEVLYTR